MELAIDCPRAPILPVSFQQACLGRGVAYFSMAAVLAMASLSLSGGNFGLRS